MGVSVSGRLSDGGAATGGQLRLVVDAALAAGAGWIDLADRAGRDEPPDLQARAVAGALAAATHPPRICLQVGARRLDGLDLFDPSPAWIRAATRRSLEALGSEAVDLLVLSGVPGPRELGAALGALRTEQEAGRARRIGAVVDSGEEVDALQEAGPVDAVLAAYDIFRRRAERAGVVARCASHGLDLFVVDPYAGRVAPERYDANPVLIEIAARHGASPRQVALAWVRRHLPGSVLLISPPTPEEAADWIESAEIALTDEQISRLTEGRRGAGAADQ